MAEFEAILSSSITKDMAAVEVSEFITAPAAFTLVASVTSAHASIQANFDISALVVNLFVVKLSSKSSGSNTTFHT